MNEFSDRPFAAGSLFGIRSFRVDSEGQLTGCVVERAWRTGVNEAGCHRPVDTAWQSFAQIAVAASVSAAEFQWAAMRLSAQMTGRVLLTKRPKPPPRPATRIVELPPHDVGSLTCTCGFYAYFDLGHNPHHSASNVLGVIEGYGITTVGSRGFRASKARIRALIGPPRVLDPQYDGIPWFPSVDAALTEFPLTPVEQPEPVVPRYGRGGFVPASWATGITAQQWAVCEEPRDETPQERALRLRRERNTGPTAQHGIDGHYRRRQANG